MMKRSTVPEIATLANAELAIYDYWNDTSNNIEVISEQDIGSMTEDRSILKDDESRREKLKLHLLSVAESDKQSGISPNFTYDMFVFPKAADFEKDSFTEKSNVLSQDKDANEKTIENDLELSVTDENQPESSSAVLQR